MATDDPFHLARFISAQESTYPRALAELQRGRKESHWMWFIFPQLDGLGSSPMARQYAIKTLEEAQAYLEHEVLGPRLLACCTAILAIEDRSAHAIFGSPDDLKLKSSMTLFAQLPDAPAEFGNVLQKYFAGQSDEKTVALVQQ
jgi:uncharacterized protein (DUF1810 family)